MWPDWKGNELGTLLGTLSFTLEMIFLELTPTPPSQKTSFQQSE